MYQLLTNPRQKSELLFGVKRVADNAFIPFDPANTDYTEYLKWLEAGNEPIPADTQPEQP